MELTASKRTRDGLVKETLMPDGTIVETFLDKKNDEEGMRHIFRRPDFSVIVADFNGDMTFISSNSRSALNENGGKVAMGKDYDYAYEFRKGSDDYTPAIYYARLVASELNSHILTVDEHFKYVMTADH